MDDLSPDWLRQAAAGLGLTLSADQAGRLAGYAAGLRFWSRRINLLGPAARDDLWPHLAEGLLLEGIVAADGPPGRMADLGAGAGLPGLVLACLHPDWPIDLFEARARKASFLDTMAAEQGLPLARAVNCRVPESAPTGCAGAYRTVVSRAAAPLDALAAPAGWLLAPGGRLYALKGPALEDEVARAGGPLAAAGLTLVEVRPLAAPGRSVRLAVLERAPAGPSG